MKSNEGIFDRSVQMESELNTYFPESYAKYKKSNELCRHLLAYMKVKGVTYAPTTQLIIALTAMGHRRSTIVPVLNKQFPDKSYTCKMLNSTIIAREDLIEDCNTFSLTTRTINYETEFPI